MAVLFAAELPIARLYTFYLAGVALAAMVLRRHRVPIIATGAPEALVVPYGRGTTGCRPS